MLTYDETVFIGLIVGFVLVAARLFWLGDVLGSLVRRLLGRG